MEEKVRYANMAYLFILSYFPPDSANVKKESNDKRGEQQKV